MKKQLVGLLSVLVVAVPVQAETIEEALRTCGQTQNSLKRLVCYDGVVQQLDKYSGLSELMDVPAPLPSRNRNVTGTAPQAASPRNTAPAEKEFGLENRVSPEREDQISATISAVKEDPYGKLEVTFSDGQVWKQTDSARIKLSTGDDIYVERGVLGSFFLSKEGINSRIRVKRIR